MSKEVVVWVFDDISGLCICTCSTTREKCWRETWNWLGYSLLNNMRNRKSNGYYPDFKNYKDRAFRDFMRRHRGKPVKAILQRREEDAE